MDQVQNRVQNAVTTLLERLDQEYLRQMQGDMYRCNANCCDDSNLNMQHVQRCIESCSTPLTSSQKYIEGEISNFQNRLQRCAYQCQDNVKDKVLPSTSDSEMRHYQQEMEGCIVKCADDHIGLVDNMMVRMRENLKVAQNKQQQPQQPAPMATAGGLPSMGGGLPGGLPAGAGLGGAAPSFPRRIPPGVNPLGMPMGPRPGAGVDD